MDFMGIKIVLYLHSDIPVEVNDMLSGRPIYTVKMTLQITEIVDDSVSESTTLSSKLMLIYRIILHKE